MAEHVYNISARVLVYSMLCTLLLAVAVSAAMGWLAWISQHEAAELRQQQYQMKDAQRICRIALERADAKMELVDDWITNARRYHSDPGTGGEAQ